jgi:hypothetical protein
MREILLIALLRPPLPGKLTLLQLEHQGALWRESMRRYSEAFKANVKRRMSQQHYVRMITTQLRPWRQVA